MCSRATATSFVAAVKSITCKKLWVWHAACSSERQSDASSHRRSSRRNEMKNFPKGLSLSTLVLGGAMSAAAFAQTAPATATPTGSDQRAAVAADPAASSTTNADGSYATA